MLVQYAAGMVQSLAQLWHESRAVQHWPPVFALKVSVAVEFMS